MLARGLTFLTTLLLALAMAPSAWADPPTLAGRVAELSGVVWLYDADNREWTALTRNQTVAQGDRLRTDANGRVAVRLGSTNFWLDGRSDVLIAQMDEGRVVLQLDEGRMGLRLRSREAVVETSVLTHEGRVFAESEGLYRIDQLDRATRITALQGRVRFESDRYGTPQFASLREGEQADFRANDGARPNGQRVLRDPFNDFLLAQTNAPASSYAIDRGFLSIEMTGAEDLDQYGRWEEAPEYGNVWFPTRVARDWAPYRDGRWVWTRQWGWSWVDDTPWGFAPFHYGRWVSVRGRWAWTPGRYERRPVYAPALVTWTNGWPGRAGGPSPDRHPPRSGWTPLAPRDTYVPGYNHSPGYANRINNGLTAPILQRPQRDERVPQGIPYNNSGNNGRTNEPDRAWQVSPAQEPSPQDRARGVIPKPRHWDDDGPATVPVRPPTSRGPAVEPAPMQQPLAERQPPSQVQKPLMPAQAPSPPPQVTNPSVREVPQSKPTDAQQEQRRNAEEYEKEKKRREKELY